MRKGVYLGTGVGIGMAGWFSLSHQHQADIEGSVKSIGSSFLAFWVLGKTVYNYHVGLKGL